MPPKNDMWNRLAEAESRHGIGPDTLDASWFTRQQYQEKYGIGHSAAERRLKLLINAGELETKWAMLTSGGQSHRVHVYRLKDK